MVAFGHTAVGSLVGLVSYRAFGSGDIALGLVATGFAGVLSHYLMDLVPHGHFFTDPRKYDKLIIWVILFDLLLPVLFFLAAAHLTGRSGTEILYILFGIGGAQLPDVFDGLKRIKLLPKTTRPLFIGKILGAENKFHMSTHWHGKEEKALLISILDVWQFSVLVLAVTAIIYFR